MARWEAEAACVGVVGDRSGYRAVAIGDDQLRAFVGAAVEISEVGEVGSEKLARDVSSELLVGGGDHCPHRRPVGAGRGSDRDIGGRRGEVHEGHNPRTRRQIPCTRLPGGDGERLQAAEVQATVPLEIAGELDAREATDEAAERDLALESRQRGTETVVRASAE